MKKIATICMSVLMSLTVFSQLSSAGELKIAVVSMEQVFDQYYKTKKANELLKKRFDKSDLKKRELMDAVKTLKAELKTLAMEATDSSLSSAEQDKKKRLSEKKYIAYLDAEEKLIMQMININCLQKNLYRICRNYSMKTPGWLKILGW